MFASFTRKRDTTTNPIGDPTGSGTLPDDIEGPPAAKPREDASEPSEVRIDALEVRLKKLASTVATQADMLAACITTQSTLLDENKKLKAELAAERAARTELQQQVQGMQTGVAKFAGLQEACEKLDQQVKQVDAKVKRPSYAAALTDGVTTELRAQQVKAKEDIEQLQSQAEQQDRMSRAAHVMVFGLQETDGQSPAEQVSECLRSVGAPGRERIVRAVRIGQQRNAQQPRPVKVVMATETDAVNVLRRTRELRQRRQVRVDRDLTPAQTAKRKSQLGAAQKLRDLGYFTVFNADKLLFFKRGSNRREVFTGQFPNPV